MIEKKTITVKAKYITVWSQSVTQYTRFTNTISFMTSIINRQSMHEVMNMQVSQDGIER